MLADHPTIALDPIPGFPGYFACRLGVIFSNRGSGVKYPKPLKAETDSSGYLRIELHKNGHIYKRRVHRLILETYIGPRPPGDETRHLNSVKTDNRLSNLRWGTHAENARDMAQTGRYDGARNPAAKLSEDDIRIIRTLTATEASKRYGIHKVHAHDIIRRKKWKHVP
jgi:hypothetical protein